MKNQSVGLETMEIFEAWKRLEANDKTKIEWELNLLKEVCRECSRLMISATNNYIGMYNFYCKPKLQKLSIIMTFFREVKENSKNAYECISEGHDIANIVEYMELKGKNPFEIANTIFTMSEYSIYIKHAFLRIIDETDEEKKYVMLRGLIGM